MSELEQAPAPAVPARARQGAETRDWSWVEATIWTERMVLALENGVKGGCWLRWTKAFFAKAGLLALDTAWQAARHSR